MAEKPTGTRIALLEKAVSDMKKSQSGYFKKLFAILEGEGSEPGLKGQVQLQGASLKRLYKWVAGLTVLAVGAIEEIIRRYI